MRKLTNQEIEEKMNDEESIAMYRMFTAKGVHLRMKIANFYYNHYSYLTYIIIQFPLLIVDTIDVIGYIINKKRKSI